MERRQPGPYSLVMPVVCTLIVAVVVPGYAQQKGDKKKAQKGPVFPDPPKVRRPIIRHLDNDPSLSGDQTDDPTPRRRAPFPDLEDEPTDELNLDQDRTTARPARGTIRFNVGLAMTEALLNEIASGAREQTQAVADQILGAQVSGSQRTRSNYRIDCLESRTTGRLNVVLESCTNTHTVGFRPDARITTEGCHRADLRKPVFFDGQRITTKKPEGFVRARNLNRGIMTPFSTLPIVGMLVDDYARSENERLRPLAESIAAQRLAGRIVPEFNQNTDSTLSSLNEGLRQTVQPWLRRNDLMPSETTASSTDTELRVRARYGDAVQATGPGRRVYGKYGSLLLHESVIASLADRLNLRGREMTDKQLQQLISRLENPKVDTDGEGDLTRVEKPPIDDAEIDLESADFNKPEPVEAAGSLYTILFDATDPLSVHFRDNDTRIVLRLGIRPVLGTEIDTQEVHIPVTSRVEETEVILEFGDPTVSPVDGSESGMTQQLIGQQIGRLLKPIRVPRSRTFALNNGKLLSLKIGRIEAANGWLLLAVD